MAGVKLSALPDPVQPHVLDQTPAVLSVGTVCRSRLRLAGSKRKTILVRPDGKVVQLNQYVKKDRSHRQLLTWTGVVSVPVDDIETFLENLYDRNRPLVLKNIERKEKQSQLAKKRKAEEDAQKAAGAATSSTRVEASSSARPFLEPEFPPDTQKQTKTIFGARANTIGKGIQLRSP